MQFLLSFLSFLVLYFAIQLYKIVYNPYKLVCLVGKKGSGKTYATYRAIKKWQKKHNHCNVYSNFDVGTPLSEKFWLDEYEPNSVICLDEISVSHDNRSFKDFPAEFGDWLRMIRKRKLYVVVNSQTMDFDKKIRSQTDYLCKCNRFFLWVVITRYRHAIVLADDVMSGGKKLVDTEKFAGIHGVYFLPGAAISDYNTNLIIKRKEKAEKS